MSDFDGGWKDALDWFLGEILAFFYPQIHADIDWTREAVSLEQEFRAASPQSVGPMVRCDKLLRLHLLGEHDPAYIHIEVACQVDVELGRRVFDYGVGATLLYRDTVVSLVVLGDDDPEWLPSSFARRRWGLGTTVDFGPAKIVAHRGREAELERMDGVVGLIVLAHVKAIDTRRDPAERRAWRLRLWRAIRQRGLEFESQQRLVGIVERFLTLPAEVEADLRREIFAEEREGHMPYVTSFERLARAEARVEALCEGVRAVLDVRFGSVDPEFAALMGRASVATLERLLVEARTASLDDLRRTLTEATG